MVGFNGIIGKSLTIYANNGTKDDPSDDDLIGCCRIVIDEFPSDKYDHGNVKGTEISHKKPLDHPHLHVQEVETIKEEPDHYFDEHEHHDDDHDHHDEDLELGGYGDDHD